VNRKKVLIISAWGIAGLAILMGIATPKFLSMTSTPRFCNSCHVMNDQYETWFMTGVHRTITCIDCHLPNDNVIRHLIWKGIDGAKDFLYFHSGRYTEPIDISLRGKSFIKDNCIRCHTGVVSRIQTEGQDCWSCHRRINHMAAIFNPGISR
jgi:cytochrome c nitrite reductase small subunit